MPAEVRPLGGVPAEIGKAFTHDRHLCIHSGPLNVPGSMKYPERQQQAPSFTSGRHVRGAQLHSFRPVAMSAATGGSLSWGVSGLTAVAPVGVFVMVVRRAVELNASNP